MSRHDNIAASLPSPMKKAVHETSLELSPETELHLLCCCFPRLMCQDAGNSDSLACQPSLLTEHLKSNSTLQSARGNLLLGHGPSAQSSNSRVPSFRLMRTKSKKGVTNKDEPLLQTHETIPKAGQNISTMQTERPSLRVFQPRKLSEDELLMARQAWEKVGIAGGTMISIGDLSLAGPPVHVGGGPRGGVSNTGDGNSKGKSGTMQSANSAQQQPSEINDDEGYPTKYGLRSTDIDKPLTQPATLFRVLEFLHIDIRDKIKPYLADLMAAACATVSAGRPLEKTVNTSRDQKKINFERNIVDCDYHSNDQSLTMSDDVLTSPFRPKLPLRQGEQVTTPQVIRMYYSQFIHLLEGIKQYAHVLEATREELAKREIANLYLRNKQRNANGTPLSAINILTQNTLSITGPSNSDAVPSLGATASSIPSLKSAGGKPIKVPDDDDDETEDYPPDLDEQWLADKELLGAFMSLGIEPIYEDGSKISSLASFSKSTAEQHTKSQPQYHTMTAHSGAVPAVAVERFAVRYGIPTEAMLPLKYLEEVEEVEEDDDDGEDLTRGTNSQKRKVLRAIAKKETSNENNNSPAGHIPIASGDTLDQPTKNTLVAQGGTTSTAVNDLSAIVLSPNDTLSVQQHANHNASYSPSRSPTRMALSPQHKNRMVTLRALSRTINGQQQSPFGNNTSPERGNNNTTLPSSLNTRDTSYTKAKTRIATPFLTDHTIGAGSLDIPNKKNAVSGNKHQQIKRPGTSSHQSHNTNTFIVSTYGVDGAEVDEVDFDRLAKEIDGEMSNHASDEEIEYYYYYDELEGEKATDKTNIDGQKNQLHENNSTSLRRGRKGAHAQPAFTHINGLAKQPIPKYFTHAQRTSNFSTYQELPPTVLMYREREEKREEAAQLEKKLQAEQARNEANVSNPFYRGDKTALTPAGKKKAEVDKLKQKEKTEFDRLTAGKSALHGMRHAAHGKNTEALLVHAAALLKESLPLLKTTRE